ncbi:MAG: hypothetical protein RMM17_10690 [Acidobacteriota bacterium]|nr:hypothetical protein [Blastocatellia bacterium]MDW8413138.1 hypothetical protein [Acidobacteriota bacterium]
MTERWLFSARTDIVVFAGSALLSLLLLFWGTEHRLIDGESPEWVWVTGVLLVDVAHVWATGFRVYFDVEELKRRPYLYISVPMLGYLLGIALYSEGELVFWRVLAYVAVYHFVRQQYGWVALYRARARERDRLGYWIDSAAVYAGSLYPLIYWHLQLPRNFAWFVQGDFMHGLPWWLERIALGLYVFILAAYTCRSLWSWLAGRANPGKDLVVFTTAICWYAGIVVYNSDFAFTVTNVFIHGIPYIVLVYVYARRRAELRPNKFLSKLLMKGPWVVLLSIWALAYIEELFWDRTIWHERSWLFGSHWELADGSKLMLVPLLALPQVCHYVLDGFIWKRKQIPELFS